MHSWSNKIAKKETDNSFYFFRLIKHSYNEMAKPVIPVYPNFDCAVKALANIIGYWEFRGKVKR